MKVNKINFDAAENTKYNGIATVYPVMVNPNSKELEALYSSFKGREPNYKIDTKDANKRLRLDIYLKTKPDFNDGIDKTFKITFFVGDKIRTNKDNTKLQYINDYGVTCWIPENDFSQCPSFFEQTGARPAYEGEEDITNFIKALYNIPMHSYIKPNGEPVVNPEEDCVCKIEKWKEMINGDLTEIKDIIKTGFDQLIKVLVGINEKGYEQVYSHKIGRFTSKPELFRKELENRAKFDSTVNEIKYSFEVLKPFSIENTKPETIYDSNSIPEPEATEDLPF